ncbi:hypothetical protein BKA82DRAFT_995475 [Pisolithus tinctorius]|uniref:Uncharacterized protein n=1 Tax=Pisolithus tinctorius Marx 270 TaxID=870435 RepID=A0A0C3JM78_PISTI|nr:hypothetical protein BKA82DRAFT_995475 [Pisolithus tinctorius]KIO10268.1 hypothetical protein M404DRAFT_995475 [Pisolithus tinctorius Marx 270]
MSVISGSLLSSRGLALLSFDCPEHSFGALATVSKFFYLCHDRRSGRLYTSLSPSLSLSLSMDDAPLLLTYCHSCITVISRFWKHSFPSRCDKEEVQFVRTRDDEKCDFGSLPLWKRSHPSRCDNAEVEFVETM